MVVGSNLFLLIPVQVQYFLQGYQVSLIVGGCVSFFRPMVESTSRRFMACRGGVGGPSPIG